MTFFRLFTLLACLGGAACGDDDYDPGAGTVVRDLSVSVDDLAPTATDGGTD